MRLSLCAAFLFQAIFIIPTLSSQTNNSLKNLRFRQIKVEDGLPSNLTHAASEDKFGFCWIATSEGLCRYDGTKFKVFKNDPGDSLSLSNNHVRSVFTDSKGNVWAGLLNDGVCVYDYNTGHFTRYKNDLKNPNLLVGNNILSFFEDIQHNIWIGTEQGISIFNPSTKSFTTYAHNNSDPTSIGQGGVISIAEDAQHRIWLTTWDGGLNLFLPKTNTKGSFRQFYPSNCKHFWSLYLDSQNRFWVGSFDGGLTLMKFDNSQSLENLKPEFINFCQNSQKPNSISDNMIFDIDEDNTGKIWVATPLGLNIFDPSVLRPESMSLDELRQQQEKIYFNVYNYERNNSFGIPSHQVVSLAKGKSGIMWICTADGFALNNPQKNTFQARFIDYKGSNGFTDVTSVVKEPSGRIWYGTQNDGIFINMPNSDKYIRLETIAPNSSILNGNIGKLYLDNNKYIWVGCKSGLVRMDLKNYSCKLIISNKNLPPSYQNSPIVVSDVLKDKKGNIWFSTTEGVFRYNPKTSKINYWRKDANNPNSLSDNDTSGMIEDDNGNIWITSYKGVDKLSFAQDGENYTFTNYRHNPNDPQSLVSNRTTSITKKDEYIYVCTEAGFSRTKGDGKFTTYGNSKTLGELSVKSLIAGKGDYLWGACNSGLFRFDCKTEKFHFFDIADGIHDNSFSPGSVYKSKENEIFFCGRMGATSFYEKDILINDSPSNFYLTNISINNKLKKLDSDIVTAQNIKLQYDENNVSFEFSALNFLKPKSVKYAYKLEGYDKEWIFTGNLSTAVYTNLSGGDYTFKVKYSDENGEWVNDRQIAIPVHLAKPFWEEIWFYVSCIILLCIVIYIFIRSRTETIREKNRVLENYNNALNKEIAERKRVEESLIQSNQELILSNKDLEQFAYIASHDLQEPLRMVGNYVQLLNRRYYNTIDENGKTYIDFAVEGVTRMSELLLNILNFSKVGKMDIQLYDTYLKKVVEDKIHELDNVIKKKNVKIELIELPLKMRCEPAQMGAVFQHLINNAIKFNKNPEPKVTIKCEEHSDYWLFSIEDNGIGIKPEYQDKVFEIFKRLNTRDKYEGNGIGLSICKRIIYRHGGKIWLTSEIDKGTVFFFTISKNIVTPRSVTIQNNSLAA